MTLGIAGLRGIGDATTDERPKNFREMIAFRKPNAARAPITALMSKIRSESVDDMEFHWWDEPVALVRLQSAASHAAGDTLITVDSPDPSSSAPNLNWGVATHLKPGSLLQVEKAAQVAYDNEIVEVVQVVSNTQFVVRRGACGTTPATIGNDAWLFLISSSYAEGGSPPRATSTAPIRYLNYLHTIKTTYEITKEAVATKMRTGDPLKLAKMRAADQHSQAIEGALIWSVKSSGVDALTGKVKYTTDGIRKLIPSSRVTSFSGNVTAKLLLDAVYPVFDWQSDAGDERIAFGGNAALNALNLMVQYERAVSINFNETVKIFGLDFRKFVMPQGTLFFRTHPMFNLHSLYTKDMLVMDFSSWKWRFLKGFDTDFKDNLQLPGEMVYRGQWMTIGGLEMKYAGLTNAYLANITYTPA